MLFLAENNGNNNASFPVHRHHHLGFYTLLLSFLFVVIVFLFVGVAETAFQVIGFSKLEFAVILFATFLGSFVNIPLYRIKKTQRVLRYEEVRAFWVTYRVPHIGIKEVHTTIALNLGGAVIPIVVSGYLVLEHLILWPDLIVGVVLTSIIVHLVARKIEGVGIVTPAFIPPFAAAVIALLISSSNPAVIAYVSGSLGALIGADLSNLRGMGTMGESVASIGGAGTFDGVFLTGLVAVIIVIIFAGL